MKPTSPKRALHRLRTRLELRGLRPNSVDSYLRHVRQFLEAVDKPPSRVTRRDVERYLLGLRSAGKSVSTRNVSLSSIRFLLLATTSKDVTTSIPRVKKPRTLVTVLSVEEVERLFAATDSPMYRAIFMAAYGAGLRIGEVRQLRIDDIDSARGLIHVLRCRTASLGGHPRFRGGRLSKGQRRRRDDGPARRHRAGLLAARRHHRRGQRRSVVWRGT